MCFDGLPLQWEALCSRIDLISPKQIVFGKSKDCRGESTPRQSLHKFLPVFQLGQIKSKSLANPRKH